MLPVYRIYLDDGSSYITSMSATLAEARRYFLGSKQEQHDERTILTVVRVEQVTDGGVRDVATD